MPDDSRIAAIADIGPQASARRFDALRVGQWVVLLALSLLAVWLWRVQTHGLPGWPDPGGGRLLGAAGVALLYVGACAWPAIRRRRRRHGSGEWLVLHASQTGSAERLAHGTARALGVKAMALGELDTRTLARAGRALFVVSTTGDGDAPDGAAAFMRRMEHPVSLSRLRYAVLALGDSGYPRYCAFGRGLDRWLADRGAHALFERVEVDRGDDAALSRWSSALATLGADTHRADAGISAQSMDTDPWRLVERRHLNPGSPGAAVYRLDLSPRGEMPDWQAGDVARVLIDDGAGRGTWRDYSVASLPAEGMLTLLVRRVIDAGGRPGRGSDWLCRRLETGAVLRIEIRANPAFRLPDKGRDTPLLLIGNGTGIAGLRAHLVARIASGRHRNWLCFGERAPDIDLHFGEDLARWRADGVLQRMDCAWSRAGGEPRYVQALLSEHAASLAPWLREATVMVCGGRDMAAAVEAALGDVLGDASWRAMRADGRYLADVY